MNATNLVKAILFAEPPSNDSKSVFSTISDKVPDTSAEPRVVIDLSTLECVEDIPYQALEYAWTLQRAGVHSATLYVTRHLVGYPREYQIFTWVPDMSMFSHANYGTWVRELVSSLLNPIYPNHGGTYIQEYADNLPESASETYLSMSNFKLAKSLGEVLNLSLVNVTTIEPGCPIFKFVVNRD